MIEIAAAESLLQLHLRRSKRIIRFIGVTAKDFALWGVFDFVSDTVGIRRHGGFRYDQTGPGWILSGNEMERRMWKETK